METILRIDNIEKYYGNKSSLTKAIDNISFEVRRICIYNGSEWLWKDHAA